jgi:hypothetical protein
VSERENIKFHNVKFESIIDETLPEDRFGEFIKPRVAESNENMDEIPPEGKVVMKKVTLKNAQGHVIKRYNEELEK